MALIRVLHILTALNRGGIETMLMNYYRNIDRSKVQFDFLLHRPGKYDYTDEIIEMGGRIYNVPPYNPVSKEYWKSLDLFFREHKEYSVVHCHLNCLSAIPLKLAKRNGIPTRIAHSHIILTNYDLKDLYKRVARFFIKRYATDLYACSEEAGKWMFGSREIVIMPNAVDSKTFLFSNLIREKVRTSIGVKNEIVIGCVGRLTKQKNQKFVIDIANKLVSDGMNIKVILIGEGEDKDSLVSLVDKYHLKDTVIFTGTVNNVNEWMQAFDIFLFPSLYEGLGIVAVEAQIADLPTICSNRVPVEVKINEKCIFLPINNIDNWCKTIKKIRIGYRESKADMAVKSGYDIHSAATKFQEIYISKAR